MEASSSPMAARGKLVYGLYRAATRMASPLMYALVQWRRLRGLEHPSRWPERFGHPSSPRPPGPLLWFHAVSLGRSFLLLSLSLPVPARLRLSFYDRTLIILIPFRRGIDGDPCDQALHSSASRFPCLDDDHHDLSIVWTAIYSYFWINFLCLEIVLFSPVMMVEYF